LKTKTGVDVLGAGAQKNLKKIEDSSKVVIAAVNGYAFGGGCEIALACDIRIISNNAIFGLPEVGLGILPGAGGTQRLSKLIGLGRAKEVILASKTINSTEALEYGLAAKSVKVEDLMSETHALAGRVMKNAPLALRLCKRLINASVSTDQETGMLLELFGLSILMNSEDKMEGIDSFLNKRKPEFKGK
jgi:enoyl-CoA hydratase